MADDEIQKVEIVNRNRDRDYNDDDWDGTERRKELYNQHIFRIIQTVWMILFSVVAIYMFLQNRDRSTEGRQAKAVLCIFKHDLTVRAQSTRAFINDHPQGFAGIPITVLKTSLTNQEATINSLKSLSCPESNGS